MAVQSLKLFVSGKNISSAGVLKTLQRICEEHFPAQFEISVIDIAERPDLAREFNIVATPTLVGDFAPPVQRIIGNLANADHLMVHLQRLSRTS